MQKDKFGGFEKGHSFKKPRDDRGLELAKSWRGMSHKKSVTWEAQGTWRSNREEHTPRGRYTSNSKQNKFWMAANSFSDISKGRVLSSTPS